MQKEHLQAISGYKLLAKKNIPKTLFKEGKGIISLSPLTREKKDLHKSRPLSTLPKLGMNLAPFSIPFNTQAEKMSLPQEGISSLCKFERSRNSDRIWHH